MKKLYTLFLVLSMFLNMSALGTIDEIRIAIDNALISNTTNTPTNDINVSGPVISGTDVDDDGFVVFVYNSLGQLIPVTVSYNSTTGVVNITGSNGSSIATGTYYIVIVNKKTKQRRTVTVNYSSYSIKA